MTGVIPVAQLLVGCVSGRYHDVSSYGLHALCLPSYVSPQPLHRQRMSLRAQIPLPVATPTLHATSIAAQRRNPACDSVDNAALNTIQGGVALRAYEFVRGLASDVRANTVGCVERIPDRVCSMRMSRYQLTLCPIDRERFLCGVSCHASTFVLPRVQRCFLSSLSYVEKEFDHTRGEDSSGRRAPGRTKWRNEACIACHK
jgi:hypothetical protein